MGIFIHILSSGKTTDDTFHVQKCSLGLVGVFEPSAQLEESLLETHALPNVTSLNGAYSIKSGKSLAGISIPKLSCRTPRYLHSALYEYSLAGHFQALYLE